MKLDFSAWRAVACAGLLPLLGYGQVPSTNSPAQLYQAAVLRVATLFEPPTNVTAHTFVTGLKLSSKQLPGALNGQEFTVAFQTPDRLRVSGTYETHSFQFCRDQQELWAYVPDKRFGVIGSPAVAPFKGTKGLTAAPLGPLNLPLEPAQLMAAGLLLDFETLPDQTVGGTICHVLKARAKPASATGSKLPAGTLEVWLRKSDALPLKLAYRNPEVIDVEIQFSQPGWVEAWPAERWKLDAGKADHIETISRAHLTRFLSTALNALTAPKPATLGPAKGQRCVLGREGKGRLEEVDGTRVLFLKGTPEEMGRQHALLLKKEVRNLIDRMLYGVGVGSSFEKGRWFFGEMESAEGRLRPFVDERYTREMNSLAEAGGFPPEEVRLANLFPELFHCSGFAVFGKATRDGRMYHGRVLDYLRGVGLEQNAVVMVLQPERGNAWVNVGYAGFIGSVTAMNEKGIAVGEMGGRGEGNWDGKPMAQLVREVMEKANTLSQAVEIMRKGPRTCEYYYVISDGKTQQAVGIAATPQKFEVVPPGETHPLLPHAFPDTVLMSAGDRYEELASRVRSQFGKLDAESARDLMKRPVCMTSNIHCALFAPDTLDFWVANADSVNPAAHARYTHYNLRELLQSH